MGTALSTFNIAFRRADRVYRLAVAVTDYRSYRIRADWAAKFKRLMHWPQRYEIDRVDSGDAIIILRDGSDLARADFQRGRTNDLLRASLVMAVSAMDAYFHAKVCRYVIAHSKKAETGSRLMNLRITVADFVRGNGLRYRNAALRAAVERHLYLQSLQTPENIADAVALIGVSDFWNSVAAEMGQEAKGVRKRLSAISRRRNQIAHEGDLSQSKLRRNKSHSISRKYTRDALDFVGVLVCAANKVIDAKKVV